MCVERSGLEAVQGKYTQMTQTASPREARSSHGWSLQALATLSRASAVWFILLHSAI